jgi:hypothetical protein
MGVAQKPVIREKSDARLKVSAQQFSAAIVSSPQGCCGATDSTHLRVKIS